jgi:acyl-CoA thioesterase-1
MFFAWLALSAFASAAPRTAVFFGDSLTAGLGLANPGADAYPALIQEKIRAAGLDWRVVNAGLSGETTAGGLRRVDWILRQPVDLFFLALGSNDGLRGLPPAVTRDNLRQIVGRVRAKYPHALVVLAGQQMPPQLGTEFTREFAALFPAVATQFDLPLVPFLLEGVGGDPRYNQADRIHPNPAGHKIMAATVWKTLEPLLRTPPPKR